MTDLTKPFGWKRRFLSTLPAVLIMVIGMWKARGFAFWGYFGAMYFIYIATVVQVHNAFARNGLEPASALAQRAVHYWLRRINSRDAKGHFVASKLHVLEDAIWSVIMTERGFQAAQPNSEAREFRELSTEIADKIIESWANCEAGPLDIPKGRLWVLRTDIAEAIRHERALLLSTEATLREERRRNETQSETIGDMDAEITSLRARLRDGDRAKTADLHG